MVNAQGSQATERANPTVFISYSWDNDDHVGWVRTLAARLVDNGVTVLLDQWHVQPGESITKFMEESVTLCDRVVVVCTPNFAERSAKRLGGVGYEQQIVSGNIAAGIPRRKFIPIVRRGTFDHGPECAIPPHLLGVFAIDLRADAQFGVGLEKLLRAIYDEPIHKPPTLGPRPSFGGEDLTDEDDGEADDDQIGVLPRMDVDGWELSNGEERSANHPDTFQIPSAEDRSSVPIGHFIKVAFDATVPDEEAEQGWDTLSERMWIKVIGFDGPYIIGTWANQSLAADVVPQLAYGRPVAVLPEHVIDIRSFEEMEELAESLAKERAAEGNEPD
ncbi:toll/interleukin-1 receptor domain-containing protein [Rhizobium bangladeshense]|uniref:Toll/interleukin-1 receptor domain-containing protein n=1 Tax=Rhizobium bangladeshense TaxID=1138189 RepID=A0ABS7LFA8_9HYPH|nr:toll/interleukin-1 receptor domain-containing protein [Rhizobium bangladeshense]MBX4872077.1 toll/interleukin-1 receptor domain-containing protein [Rhizobium bangladeshense]MBY3589925.1 toll/interleukin-1 receptor domain-containing protein [Rhizobium bangladeshense]